LEKSSRRLLAGTEFVVEPYPASTALGITELAIQGLEIEIEAIAIR